jgi:SHS2 domain-containing protein
MVKYKYLEHTADAKFRAYGKNFEEAISNAVTAMFGMLTDIEKVKPKIKRKIEIKAENMKSLVYDFLDELLFLLDTEGIIFTHLENVEFKEFSIKATAVGDSYKNYDISGNIKSMTYNDMVVEDKNGRFIIQCVVDI